MKGLLKAHVETVHEVKKPFQCSLCPAKFGSEQGKAKHLASNHAITKETQIKNQSENQEFKLILATETRREYSLPYGWKKIGHRRSETLPKERLERWDFYIFSPYGKMLRSAPEVQRYLGENPELECDLEVTNTSYPYDMLHLRPGWRASVKHEKTSHFEKKLSKKVTKTKGQLISKCPYEIIVSSKIPTKFPGFLPWNFCTLLRASWKLSGASCRLPYL